MTTWPGAWVHEHAGVHVSDTGLVPGLAIGDLFGLALRINPRRPHLLVSTVLAKHVPTDPRVVRGTGMLLGLYVARALDARRSPFEAGDPLERVGGQLGKVLREGADPAGFATLVDAAADAAAAAAAADNRDRNGVNPTLPGLVLGYAETATALGHLVGRVLRTPSLHSTRRRVPGFVPALGFDELHSHAVGHLVLPDDAALVHQPGPVVLVDDELSTGRTALSTIRALHALTPRPRYVIAALIDVRREVDRQQMSEVAAELGTDIDVVALASGEVRVPDDIGARLDAAPGGFAALEEPEASRRSSALVTRDWPWGGREGGRHGFRVADEAALHEAVTHVAGRLAGRLAGDRVLVLGTEELMYAPLSLAGALQRVRPQARVRFSTTTRSPVRVLDDEGYAVRSGITFAAHDDRSDGGTRFAYNIGPEGAAYWTDIVLVVDSPTLTAALLAPGGAADQLARRCTRLEVVVVPVSDGFPEPLTGPSFGSYDEAEVSWLLQDLSHVDLEADVATREAAIQSGAAHYAESLPVEYQPEEAYQRLFHHQLAAVAPRVATAVGAVTELALSVRGRDDLVLVSLARAGTPIGVLMRRWAARRGLEWPHHAISIVRDRGIDMVALRYLASRYDPARVLFVDGWTGKGAITREFTAAVRQANADLGLTNGQGFDPELAVLADPGSCVSLYGTRDDFLIPSACLNSTVSGLVSRTVLNDELVGPDDFHGAKFYGELAARDVSGLYLDAISTQYDAVADTVEADVRHLLATDRSPTWVGWAAAERLRVEHGQPHINLVKPGVGETTRVLLRRVPWKIVVNPTRRDDLRHVEMLAADRGVELVDDADLPYGCVGLIRPNEKDG